MLTLIRKIDRCFVVVGIFCIFWILSFKVLGTIGLETAQKVETLRQRLRVLHACQAYFKAGTGDLISYAGKIKNTDMAEMLRELQVLAQQSGLCVEHMKPAESLGPSGNNRASVQMSFLASENGWMKFLSRIEKAPVWSVAKIALHPALKSDEQIRGELTMEKIRGIDDNDWGRALTGDQKMMHQIRQVLDQQRGPSLAPAAKKNLFRKPYTPVVKNIALVADNTKDVLKNLNLVGIVDDGGIKAVIEDAKSGKSYFLKTTDMIADLKVAEIKPHEVVLEAEGKRYSLMM